MADVKVYLMATAGGHTTPNQDDFSVARNSTRHYNALYGPGAIVNIPYNTPSNPDTSRDAPWLYVGKTNYLSNPLDPTSLTVQSDTAFTLFDLYTIPAIRTIKKVRLLIWIGGGFNDIPWEANTGNNTFNIGVIKWNWGTTYPFDTSLGIPDDELGEYAYLGGLCEPNNSGKDWWVRMLKQSDDHALTPANCTNYNLEYISVDDNPVNYRYYMVLPIKPNYYPTTWGGGPGTAYYRIAVCYDLATKVYSPATEKSWIKFGSANKNPGAERCFLEVTYGEPAGEARGDAHAFFNVPYVPVVSKRIAAASADMHASLDNAIFGIRREVSATVSMHGYVDNTPIKKYVGGLITGDAHTYLYNEPTGSIEVRVEAEAHAFFGFLDVLPRIGAASVDAHAYLELATIAPPFDFVLILRNFSTSKLVPFVKIENTIPMSGVLTCTFGLSAAITSLKNVLSGTINIKIEPRGYMVIGKLLSVNTVIHADIVGTIKIRGDA